MIDHDATCECTCNRAFRDGKAIDIEDPIKYADHIKVIVDEGERQMLMLAIAKLGLENPGWDMMLETLSDKFQGKEMYEKFKDIHFDFQKELERL